MEFAQRPGLADLRRLTAELCAEIRRLSDTDPQAAWKHFRDARNALFQLHTQSPLDATGGERGAMTLYWIDGYGGGRYLSDSIEGADLGSRPDRMVLDFNFACNPSCAYSPRWVCPPAPRENVLRFRIAAGELAPGE